MTPYMKSPVKDTSIVEFLKNTPSLDPKVKECFTRFGKAVKALADYAGEDVAWYDQENDRIEYAQKLSKDDGNSLHIETVEMILFESEHDFSVEEAERVIAFIYQHEGLHKQLKTTGEQMILTVQSKMTDFLSDVLADNIITNITIPGLGDIDKLIAPFFLPGTALEGEDMSVVMVITLPAGWHPAGVKLHCCHSLNPAETKEFSMEESFTLPLPGGFQSVVYTATVNADFMIAGTVTSYFSLNWLTDNFTIIVPSDGQTYPRITAVKAQPFPWVAEYVKSGYQNRAIHARITRRKKDGSVWVTAEGPSSGLFIVPSNFRPNTPFNIALSAVTPDNRDGGVWVMHVTKLLFKKWKVKVIKILANGKVYKEFEWDRWPAATGFDPVRDTLVATVQLKYPQVPLIRLAAISGYSLGNWEIVNDKGGYILTVDPVKGDSFIEANISAGQRFLCRIDRQGANKPVNCKEVKVIEPVGESELAICNMWGTTRIIWCDRDMNNKYVTGSGQFIPEACELAADRNGPRVWALSRGNNQLLAYEADGETFVAQYSLGVAPASKMKYLWSIDQNYFDGSCWLWYEDVYRKYVLAKVIPGSWQIEAQAQMKHRGMIRTFRPERDLGATLPINFTYTVPANIQSGDKLNVLFEVKHNDPVPVWVRMEISEKGSISSTWFLLERTAEYQWKGEVAAGFFSEGVYKVRLWAQGYGCEGEVTVEVTVGEEAEPPSPPPANKIKLKATLLPKENQAGTIGHTKVAVEKGSIVPAKVEIIVKGPTTGRDYPITCHLFDDQWQGGIPSLFFRKPGVTFYYRAEGPNGEVGLLPENAPDKCFKIKSVYGGDKVVFEKVEIPDDVPPYKDIPVAVKIRSSYPKTFPPWLHMFVPEPFNYPTVILKSDGKGWYRGIIDGRIAMPGILIQGFIFVMGSDSHYTATIGLWPGPDVTDEVKIKVRDNPGR